MSATMTAPSPPSPVDVDHLAALEAEAVHIIREVVAELDRPVLLFSGGKDSVGHRQLGGAGCG